VCLSRLLRFIVLVSFTACVQVQARLRLLCATIDVTSSVMGLQQTHVVLTARCRIAFQRFTVPSRLISPHLTSVMLTEATTPFGSAHRRWNHVRKPTHRLNPSSHHLKLLSKKKNLVRAVPASANKPRSASS
jgi:hypothetical protein